MSTPPQGPAAAPVPQRPRVVCRRDWHADESLRFSTSGDEIWPRDLDPVRGLVLHHTKTPNAERDSAARVREVYRFHAVDRGWGDIGYHLLIDENGVVYEGRAGAADVLDGGPVVIAGHVYGHNHGNIGIALLGTLLEQTPSPLAWRSLVRVMARLAHLHDLDPMATQGVHGATTTTIRAHRDLRDTTCPGDACYALLPVLRAEVAAAVDAVARRAGAAAR